MIDCNRDRVSFIHHFICKLTLILQVFHTLHFNMLNFFSVQITLEMYRLKKFPCYTFTQVLEQAFNSSLQNQKNLLKFK